jgi:hypothetical protein
MVSAAILGEIIGANFFGAIAATHHFFTISGAFFIDLFLHFIIEPRAQNLHGLGLVFKLALFILALHHQARW